MNFSELTAVLKHVLTNQIVIGTAVVVLLYMNFCCFVANYRKRAPKPKKRRTGAPKAPAKSAANAPAGGEASEDGG
ncbi:MAG: hypothetical protein K2H09_00155, partial [Treponemataceae bacterium]|nr:hypothetical protein [Treponemataceae bacterium]